VSFSRRELSTALEYVRQHAVITPSDDEADRPTLYTTGVGCTQHGKLIADTFRVRYVVVSYCHTAAAADDDDDDEFAIVILPTLQRKNSRLKVKYIRLHYISDCQEQFNFVLYPVFNSPAVLRNLQTS